MYINIHYKYTCIIYVKLKEKSKHVTSYLFFIYFIG